MASDSCAAIIRWWPASPRWLAAACLRWPPGASANSQSARATLRCKSTAGCKPISSWPHRCAPAKRLFPIANCLIPIKLSSQNVTEALGSVNPATLKRTWESIKQIMAPGALDPLTKELLYIAVSVTNNCSYCIASHTASARGKGMTDAMFNELQAVIGMANETNKMVTGYQVEIDSQFRPPLPR